MKPKPRVLPADPIERAVLESLRRITRAIDIHSRKLVAQLGITMPQLVTLLALQEGGKGNVLELSRRVHLSSSTLIGMLDRLEKKGYVRRERDTRDRRQVFVELTPEGRKVLRKSPEPLQEKLVSGLRELSNAEKKAIRKALDKLVSLMEVGDVSAAPILQVGPVEPKA